MQTHISQVLDYTISEESSLNPMVNLDGCFNIQEYRTAAIYKIIEQVQPRHDWNTTMYCELEVY